MDTPILGSSYVAKSSNAACSRMVNLFPEEVPDGAKEPGYLQRAPGFRKLTQIGVGPINGLWAFNGLAYVVSGTELYSVAGDLTVKFLGDITVDGIVSMSDNGSQLFMACGKTAYVYDSRTSKLTPIVNASFKGAGTVGYIDGYFIFTEPNTQRFWITGLYNGTAINPLDFASAEGSPDKLLGLIVDHREIWMFGTNSVEVWYNAGGEGFPIERIQGAYNEVGCIAKNSIARLNNAVLWLGGDARGDGIVYRSEGYRAVRISTHAVEWQIQQYSTMEDAIAYTYQRDGHMFYVLTFPEANATWVFDATTNSWAERGAFEKGAYTRDIANNHIFFNGMNVVGDYRDGTIYEMTPEAYSIDGAPLRVLRSWRALPTGANDLKRTAHYSLQIDMETGVSKTEEMPKVMLRWSDDGGHTWSNYMEANVGRVGEYSTRVIFRRLGMTLKLRDRVFEITASSAVPINITGAKLNMGNTVA